MNLFEVETTEGTIYAIARDDFNARDKVNEYLKERYFAANGPVIRSVKIIAETRTAQTKNKLLT